MKRLFCALLCVVLLIALPLCGRSQSAALTSNDFRYELTAGKTAAIIRYTGSRAEPEIPGMLDGIPVTHIGESAFRDCVFLEKLRLPEGIGMIGSQAFYNCPALSEILLPQSLREIGDLAFAYCASLQKAMIPEGVRSIGEYAFGDCSMLTIAAVPASVTQIGPDAFLGTAADFSLFGREGSFVQEYAAASGISFMALAEDAIGPEVTAEDRQPPVTQDATETAQDDLRNTAEPPEDAVTATITVRFPHAQRTGTYTGEMKDGLAHGEGTFSSTNDEGIQWTYTGAWENGMMSGLGSTKWTDGWQYRGHYRENQINEGQWVYEGAVVYDGGFTACAECGDTLYHGVGKLYNRQGKLIFEGGFESGHLKETEQARMDRAAALDPACERLTDDVYAAAFSQSSLGKLVKLEGRVGSILTQDDHGFAEFVAVNGGGSAYPVHVTYQYGLDEEMAEPGRGITVWGAIVGVYRYTDKDGQERAMPQVDADVVALSAQRPQRGSAQLQLTAYKALEGRVLKNREFSFALDETTTVVEQRINPLDGTVTFVPVTYTTRLQVKSNGRDGAVVFDPIRFTPGDIGSTHTYAITEIAGFEAGMAYDPMAAAVTAVVADAGDGSPVALVFIPDDLTFDNRVRLAAIDHVFEAAVELIGRPLEQGEFTFQLLEGGEILQAESNDGLGKVAFEPIRYTTADIGTARVYTILQVPTGLQGVTYDPMVITLDVRVTDSGDGTPAVTVSIPDDTLFNNIFVTQTDAMFTFDVTLEGRAIKNREFSFQLEDESGMQQKKPNVRDGGVIFDSIPYTQDDIGKTFSYTVRQIPGTEPGMRYDTAVKPVSVAVGLDSGILKTDVTYPGGTSFTNRFEQQVSLPVLSAVDVDKTSITTGEAVTFTPIVSGGVQPYLYHYVLFRDGKQIKDIGWLDATARRSQLGTAGAVRMQVTVKDAKGNLTQAVMSPEVTVNKPAWSPMDLSGRWDLSLVITGSTGEADTPVGTVFPMQIDVKMKDNSTGTVNYYFEKFSGTQGSLTYSEGAITVVISNEWNADTLKGTVEIKDGTVTMSGTYHESSPKRKLTYSGTWTAVKAE